MVLCLGIGPFQSTCGAGVRSLYVNPTAGRDTNPGTVTRPFRTLARAQDAARAAAVEATDDLHIRLAGGTYDLSGGPVTFTAADSGRNGHRIIYESHQSDPARFSGGRRLTGWTLHDARRHIWSAPAGGLNFRQLYVNDRRAIRARYPDRTSDSDLGPYLRLIDWDNQGRTLAVHASDIRASWLGLTSTVEMVVNNHWDVARLPIASASVSPVSRDVVTVTPREPERSIAFEPNIEEMYHAPGQTFYFENSYDFLTAPGEWFLDQRAGIVYYIPRPGEDMTRARAIAPVAEDVLDVRGASHLVFRGLTVQYAGWLVPLNEMIGLQSGLVFHGTGGWDGVPIPGGVRVSGASDITFEDCTVEHMGGVGLEISDGTDHVVVERCHVYDIASVGIWDSADPTALPPGSPRRCREDMIRACSVHDVGRDYTGAGGIVSLFSDGLQVLDNEVYNSPYTGISIGSGSTDRPTSLRNNIVSGNDVHDVMQLHDDNAGIYTQSLQPGTRITGNWVHGIRRSGWADANQVADVYLDNHSAGITVAHNALSEHWVGKRIHAQADCGPLTVLDNDGPVAAVIAHAGPPPGLFPRAHTAAPSAPPAPYSGALQTGCFLRPGQYLQGGVYIALMRPDGDFVICRGLADARRPVWETGTGGQAGRPVFAAVSRRGRLEIFTGTPEHTKALLWASNSAQSPPGYFQANMQADGNLTVTPGLKSYGGPPGVWDSINNGTGTTFSPSGSPL